MTWVSYSDDFTGRPVWDDVDYSTRWHYLALVERCVRDRRWDGRLPLQAALRCSDVTDPDGALKTLEFIGLVALIAESVQIMFIEEHIPPPGQQPERLLPRKRENQRAYRKRKCDSGEHSKDCPRSCPARDRVTDRVTGNAGTGRDGTGRGKNSPTEEQLATPICASCRHPVDSAEHFARCEAAS